MSDLSTADRLAIQETLYRYCHCLDRGRWDEFASLFTDDCSLDLKPLLGLYEGTAGIRQFGEMIGSMGIFMRHLLTNIVITGDGEHAQSVAYVLAFAGQPGRTPQQNTGLYEDEFVKRNGRWLLHRRRLQLDVAG